MILASRSRNIGTLLGAARKSKTLINECKSFPVSSSLNISSLETFSLVRRIK